jgi:hypothetical protein
MVTRLIRPNSGHRRSRLVSTVGPALLLLSGEPPGRTALTRPPWEGHRSHEAAGTAREAQGEESMVAQRTPPGEHREGSPCSSRRIRRSTAEQSNIRHRGDSDPDRRSGGGGGIPAAAVDEVGVLFRLRARGHHHHHHAHFVLREQRVPPAASRGVGVPLSSWGLGGDRLNQELGIYPARPPGDRLLHQRPVDGARLRRDFIDTGRRGKRIVEGVREVSRARPRPLRTDGCRATFGEAQSIIVQAGLEWFPLVGCPDPAGENRRWRSTA